jgi:2-aminoadipate transaminase
MVLPDFTKYYSDLAKKIKASEIRELLALIRERKDVISFAGGIPDPAIFPKEKLAEIAKYVIETYGDDALQYSETKGIIEVRETLSDFVLRYRQITADAEEIIITTGSQSALDILARTLVNPGDVVITENPTYLAALGAFKNNGAKIVGIPIDEKGIKTDVLEQKLKSLIENGERVKFIYVIPVGQNPAGTTMDKDRKQHLLELASKYDTLIVEDDPYSYIIFEPNVEVASLKSMDSENRVIYMSTVSKILAPGLRIGWMIAHPELIRKFELVKQYIDLHSPTLNQYMVAEAIKRGVIMETVSKAVPRYRRKRDTMIKAIEEELGGLVRFYKPVGGLFVFTYVMDERFLADSLLGKALMEYKVAYVPGGSFHPDGSGRNSMRLNFSYPSEEQIMEGIRRLGLFIRSSLK